MCVHNIYYMFFTFFDRREEVHGEAQRALRTLPSKNEKESAGKQMPSFPEMVQYIQEKVQYVSFHFPNWCGKFVQTQAELLHLPERIG